MTTGEVVLVRFDSLLPGDIWMPGRVIRVGRYQFTVEPGKALVRGYSTMGLALGDEFKDCKRT